MPSILVINPGGSPSVTQAMMGCLDIVTTNTRHVVTCIQLAKSPPGFETDADVTMVIPGIIEKIGQSDADASVLSGFSDRGSASMCAATRKPVIGMVGINVVNAPGDGQYAPRRPSHWFHSEE